MLQLEGLARLERWSNLHTSSARWNLSILAVNRIKLFVDEFESWQCHAAGMPLRSSRGAEGSHPITLRRKKIGDLASVSHSASTCRGVNLRSNFMPTNKTNRSSNCP